MTILDKAQNWMIEIIGTMLFLAAAFNIFSLMTGRPAYVDTTISTIVLIIGLILMGYNSLANNMGNALKLKK